MSAIGTELQSTVMGNIAAIRNQGEGASKHNLSWVMVFGYFIVLFIGDLLSGLELVPQTAPDQVALALQLLLLVVAAAESSRVARRFVMPGATPVLSLVAISIASAVVNGQGAVQTVIFIRAVLGQYVLLLVLVNIRFSLHEFKRLNKAIFTLCAIQIPVAFFRLLSSGADVFLAGGSRSFGTEGAAGTFGRAGGSIGTTFPLVVIGFLFAFYLWKAKKIYILWMIGFIFFSFTTGKRAFPFALPAFLFGLYILIHERGKALSRKVLILGSLGVLGFIGGIFLHPSLNPSEKVGGIVQFRYAFEKALAYEQSMTWEGNTAGRFLTSKHLVELSAERGISAFLLGNGPATLIKSGLIDSNYHENLAAMGIAYGLTGGGWLFAQIGFLGLLSFLWLVLSFFRQSMRIRARIPDPYWKAVCGGLIGLHVVILYDTLAYSTTCVAGKVLPALWFLFLAQILFRRDIRSQVLQSKPSAS